MRTIPLTPGEPAPWFAARSSNNPRFQFDTVAGRYVVLCFFESAGAPASRQILDDIFAARERFDDDRACFFGVSVDPEDERLGRVAQQLPGVRYFWDFDRAVSRLFGAETQPADSGTQYRRFTLVLDPRLRAVAMIPFDHPETHATRLCTLLDGLPAIGPPAPAAVQAPILVVPRVFEPEFCRELIRIYDRHGGQESGFMREVDGKTVQIMDYGHKRRRDQEITDEQIRQAAMVRINSRLIPEVHKAFQFCATRIERYIVACYESTTGGHFRAHRDNTTKGTAHRRFAVSLNLNTGEYEGGNLRFPEFGPQTYTAPAGGAVVFSCSLLHEATPVTRGRRFAFLPFLYDEEAAQIRQANSKFVAGG